MVDVQRIPFILGQLESTRRYTLAVLGHTPESLWLTPPPAGPGPGPGLHTHILWHVGHLGYAQYAHFVLAIMGETASDRAAFPFDRYAALFAKGTQAGEDPGVYPAIPDLLADLARLQAHVAQRLAGFPDEQLDQLTLRPHTLARTRFDMAMWWIKHEALHTGHIALLRRLHGCPPWR
jgi:hypothetical protein